MQAKKVLDIGTGTGLIALMLAQRTDAEIYTIDIDEASVMQAGENISNSPWGGRITLLHNSFQNFVSNSSEKYDLIITNPPYFIDSYKSNNPVRNISRHNVNLSLHALLKGVETILDKHGIFALILPVAEGNKILRLVNSYGLFLKRKTDVLPATGKNVIRYMMEFTREKEEEIIRNDLIIKDNFSHEFTKEYRELTKDFYLNI
jgi:tRNA1Val (adenine37-N6)-methyltransferase